MPSTEPETSPPPIAVWSAARTVSAGALSEALAMEYAPAAVAPTAIAATISRPLTGTSCLRCRPRRPEMSMMSVAADAVAGVGVAVAVCVRCATLFARIGAELRGHRQPQRDQIVGVVKVVELGCMDDLRLAVERAIVAKVQVSEVAKLVERNDVGDFGGFGFVPGVPSGRHNSSRRTRRTVLCQPGISF